MFLWSSNSWCDSAAANAGSAAVAVVLMRFGANPDARDACERTALHYGEYEV